MEECKYKTSNLFKWDDKNLNKKHTNTQFSERKGFFFLFFPLFATVLQIDSLFSIQCLYSIRTRNLTEWVIYSAHKQKIHNYIFNELYLKSVFLFQGRKEKKQHKSVNLWENRESTYGNLCSIQMLKLKSLHFYKNESIE